MKAAILVGHRASKPGAKSEYLGKTEFQFNSEIAERLKDVADVYYRPEGSNSDRLMIEKVVAEINQTDYDIVIELHFNSHTNTSANGCECLYYHTNAKGMALANYFVNEVSGRIGIKKRRLIPIDSTGQRGGTFIVKCAATALLVEPFFGSNAEDCEKISTCLDEYCQILRDLIDKA